MKSRLLILIAVIFAGISFLFYTHSKSFRKIIPSQINTSSEVIPKISSETSRLIAKIDLPPDKSTVKGDVAIFGLAYGEAFKKYEVYYGKGSDPQKWIKINESDIPQAEYSKNIPKKSFTGQLKGNLATWDTGLSNYEHGHHLASLIGVYTVKLVVYDTKGNQKEDKVVIKAGCEVPNVYGGEVVSNDRVVKLKIEKHSFQRSFEVFSVEPINNEIPIEKGYKLLSSIYEIEPPGVLFNFDAKLAFNIKDCISKGIIQDVGIYAINPRTNGWQYLDSVIDTKNGSISASIKNLPYPYAYYCVFQKNKKPDRPILEKPDKKNTFLKYINISGAAEKQNKVELFLNCESQVVADSDFETGDFIIPLMLKDGVNKIYAKSTDQFGNVSAPSKEIIYKIKTRPPKTIKEILFKNKDFKKKFEGEAHLGDILNIELIGEDGSPKTIDTVDVKVKSSKTNPDGIVAQLLETGFNTGTYRARVEIAKENNLRLKKISAKVDKELITASSMDGGYNAEISLRDLMPPSAQKTRDFLYQESFEGDFGTWSKRGNFSSAELSLDSMQTVDSSKCLKITNIFGGGNFTCNVINAPFDTKDYPIMEFDYKISDAKINFTIKVDDYWYDIKFTSDKKTYYDTDMSELAEIKAVNDNTWRHIRINLYDLLKSNYLNTVVEEIIISDWISNNFMQLESGANNLGATFYVDNFTISKDFDTSRKKLVEAKTFKGTDWEIGFSNESDKEFSSEWRKASKIDYFIGEPFKHFPRAVNEYKRESNIFFNLTEKEALNYYDFEICIQSLRGNFAHFDILLNDKLVKECFYPFTDKRMIFALIHDYLKPGSNKLTLRYNIGGGWIMWDYLAFKPSSFMPPKPSVNWNIGMLDRKSDEFFHETEVGDIYYVGQDCKWFKKMISYESKLNRIYFYLNRANLDRDKFRLLLAIADCVKQGNSCIKFRILANGKDLGTFTTIDNFDILYADINKNDLKSGWNELVLEYLEGGRWLTWDYIVFGSEEEINKIKTKWLEDEL